MVNPSTMSYEYWKNKYIGFPTSWKGRKISKRDAHDFFKLSKRSIKAGDYVTTDNGQHEHGISPLKEYKVEGLYYDHEHLWYSVKGDRGGGRFISFSEIILSECIKCKHQCKMIEKCDFYEE